ncbi:DUF2637 domain-containing protein [Actinocorallia sp. API 0066]|uniref:DUF2637 domain-containing protein n=1 Tax=Actinocorallia sp. API 0066 TaxID=2896846 RepID=UPI001E47BB41|nr:DUF2637 domain-containing protein [Actinocorallia sp. API 0066]MCD0451910.1 DUF2637 domain-containing protein [Actinocorallia sp. API 0066]
MSTAVKAKTVTRWAAVGLMAAAVLTATGGGFAQSYSGLYQWAIEHGLTGWKAASFPLLVDLFIIVGELGLFLLALDAYAIRKTLLSWLDFMLPLFIALAGWTASLVFNVGHVLNKDFSYQATAAVPPIVSMLGLFVLLRTLHRYVVVDLTRAEDDDIKALEGADEPRQITASAVRVAQLEAPAEQLADPLVNTATAKAPAEQPAPAQAAASEAAPAKAAAPGSGESEAEQTFVDLLEPVSDLKAQPDPGSMRTIVTEALNKHNGDVTRTCADLAAEGYAIDETEVSKIRENHWFPYFAYRLVAKHGPDGKLVAQELTDLGVEFDRVALRDLVRNWRA